MTQSLDNYGYPLRSYKLGANWYYVDRRGIYIYLYNGSHVMLPWKRIQHAISHHVEDAPRRKSSKPTGKRKARVSANKKTKRN